MLNGRNMHGMKKRKRPGKPKLWRSGDACITNPSSRKFRNQARQYMPGSQKNSNEGLTTYALAKHEENWSDTNDPHDDDDDIIVGEDDATSFNAGSTNRTSVASSISGLTDCTNISFEKVQKFWTSPVEEHKQICAVLAAVTEVIRFNHGKETETEYFAALMVALQAANDEETQSAIIFLLSLIIKKVPMNVLRAKFPETSKLLFELLTQHHQNGKTSLLKHLITCLSTLFVHQDASIWIHSSNRQMFHALLTFSVHDRPKVRKSAHMSIKSLLKTMLINHEHHPAEDSTCKFCIDNLENQHSDANTSTLYTLNLLKLILRYMRKESIKAICESIWKVIKLANLPTKTSGLQTIHIMFDSNPPERNLPSSLNQYIISALYDFQPSINDVHLSPAWLKVMESGYSNFSIIDAKQCMVNLPRFFSSAMVYILSDSKEVANSAAKTMQTLMEKCFQPIQDEVANDKDDELLQCVRKIFSNLQQGLQYKYQAVWDLSLQLLAQFIQIFGTECKKNVLKCLVTLCDLHESPDYPFMADLEKTIGAAIKYLGPRDILKVVPLKFIESPDKCELSKSWMLPLMKDYIQNTELQFFNDYFLPLAAQLNDKSSQCLNNGELLEAKLYTTLQHQICSLLPSFCKNPTDIQVSFKNVARTLGQTLQDRAELGDYILLSLRHLILRTDSEEDLSEISRFSKNFLPIFFNLYTSKSDNKNLEMLSVLETIKAYLTIADKELVAALLENALKKLENDNITIEKRLCVMDLIAAMVPRVNEKHIHIVYMKTLPLISHGDMKVQKKSYRILEEICDAKSDSCRAFVLANLEDLGRNLLESVSTAVPSAKTPRLRCLTGVLRMLSSEHKDFLTSMLPEVILCTKAVNVKARAAAFNLLEEIGNAYIYFDSSAKEDCVMQYFQLIMAGMAGSTHMIIATIISITKLVRVYKDFLRNELVENLLSNGLTLLKSKDREITRAALALVKALISVLERDELESHLQALVRNVFAGRRGDKNFLRMQTRFVMEKLLKKLGYEKVLAVVPENARKFLANIHKDVEKQRNLKNTQGLLRAEKKANPVIVSKHSKDVLEDLASSDDDETVENTQDGKKTKRWILESPDNVIDLLDSKVASQITGSKPVGKRRDRSMTSKFPVSNDGKMLITEDKQLSLDNEERQAESDLIDRDKSELLLGKRTRKANGSEDNEYQPGGLGIHRPLTKKLRTSEDNGQKKSFGAEYKAKKAGGDVKIKDRPDPFAYIPLTLQSLNRRKKAKLAGQFQGIVKATKRSSAKLKGKRLSKRK